MSYLKIKGYTNFFLEGESAKPESAHLAERINKDSQHHLCLAKEFNSSYFVEMYPFDKCITKQYSDEVSYPIARSLFGSIITDNFFLHGFDISNFAYDLSWNIDAIQGHCKTPLSEANEIDTSLIKEFTNCLNQINMGEVVRDFLSKEVGTAMTNCAFIIRKPTDFLITLNSSSEEQLTQAFQEIINRDSNIVSNVISLANQYSGNIFHMGAAHCFDLIQAISSDSPYNENFFFIWPQSQDDLFYHLLDLIGTPEVIFATLNEILPLSSNLTTLPENFEIADENTLYNIAANRMARYGQDSNMDLFCSLQNLEDVEACFTKFAAAFE